MFCFIIEIIMLLAGLNTLIRAKLYLTEQIHLEGWRARAVGLIWMSPLPTSLFIGVIIGLLIQIGAFSEATTVYLSCIEPLITIVALLGSFVFVYATE